MAAFRTSVLIRHLPLGAGVLAGLGLAAGIAAMPGSLLEHLAWTSGVAALIPAAAPPLGETARALLALGGGIGAGAVTWAALYLLFGPGGWLAPAETKDAAPVRAPQLRRADAHPDCPPRRPMSAADLGTPLMEVATAPSAPAPAPAPAPAVEADERQWPDALDRPLAAFDPGAVPASPRQPQRALPPLAPGERLDTFALAAPPVIRAAPRPAKAEAKPSIDSLLRRLEEGAGRRARA